jgi:large subunit ribosomal protein L13
MVKLTQQTRSVSNEEAVKGREWFIVDADGETVGRVATKIAAVLRGKNKPSFTTHIDTGDSQVKRWIKKNTSRIRSIQVDKNTWRQKL